MTIGELLEKVKLDDRRHTRYKVHDDKGNTEWAKEVLGSILNCSWMASEEDFKSYIEFVENHKED